MGVHQAGGGGILGAAETAGNRLVCHRISSPVHRCTGCWRGDLSAFAAAAGGCSLRVPCQSVSIRPKYAKSCFLGCFAYLAVVFSGLCI